ncbi:MAG: sigma 54-interacting transcriptional regulator [Peptococcaceae bacterium]|nr:sigma 54-interacting transcriptional regulator [Peptococcaceae bacterium]MDH7524846.1 sigma 54-interacting transcriptional regulator [Peptococcaceae bacterium]
METLKLRIRFEDRIGLVMDVSAILFHYGLNIVALQLMNNMMFLEIDKHGPETWSPLKKDLESVPYILSVEQIHYMPYQSRENQIEAIINSMTPAEAPQHAFSEIIGQSPAIRGAINLARQVASTDSAVMLKGESGTGKELFAKAIHQASKRREKVFVPINCAAIPENLLESELFGYMEGAFTGAKKGGRVGLFQFASGGTIFLDEISELSMRLQVKLLRVLQESRIRPVGANEEIAVDCRVIAATNRNIEEMVQKGLFRDDLYYRLNVIPIQIPPLRQRKEDIRLLAENHLAKYRQRSGLEKKLSPEALEKLIDYNWPGNVRELENVLERALHLSGGRSITARDVIFDSTVESVIQSRDWEPEREHLKSAAARAERELILSVLKSQGGSMRRAAKVLGVSHTTVANKVRKYGIVI